MVSTALVVCDLIKLSRSQRGASKIKGKCAVQYTVGAFTEHRTSIIKDTKIIIYKNSNN